MTSSDSLALHVIAWGAARADLAQAAALRKQLPPWAPAGTPGHFLKHADEHTIVAVAAVDRAIRAHDLDVAALHEWSIIAAPRFLGRFGGVTALERYSRGGGPALSPHLIPQHSLHSVSGALSILLASRRPNLGVGGGADALAEGLLAALALPRQSGTASLWLVTTAWEPEPILDQEGNCLNAAACYGVAIALHYDASAAGHTTVGRLAMEFDSASARAAEHAELSVPALCRWIDTGAWQQPLQWQMPGGMTVVLRGTAPKARREAA